MTAFAKPARGLLKRCRVRLHATEGIAIAEFAVMLPLLLVLVVGIFDFGSAFNLKQKLGGAAREGARFAASMPTSDLTDAGTPASVAAVRDLVDSYLQAAQINDCGLSSSSASVFGTLGWQYTASGGGCPGTLTLTIERAKLLPASGTGVPGTLDIVSTQVTISYPYAWEFNRVIGLLVSGATYSGTTPITATATIPNLD